MKKTGGTFGVVKPGGGGRGPRGAARLFGLGDRGRLFLGRRRGGRCASAYPEDADRRHQDDGNRQGHARTHGIQERLGEDGMRYPLELLDDLRRYARGQLQAAAGLAAADLQATARRLVEALDEWSAKLVGQLRGVADRVNVQAG